MTRHNAMTSKIAREETKGTPKIFGDTETVFRILQREGPCTGLLIHTISGIAHHEVFARLGDLREQKRIVDSDDAPLHCPKRRESHTCCPDEYDRKPRLRKTYAIAPPNQQLALVMPASKD